MELREYTDFNQEEILSNFTPVLAGKIIQGILKCWSVHMRIHF